MIDALIFLFGYVVGAINVMVITVLIDRHRG